MVGLPGLSRGDAEGERYKKLCLGPNETKAWEAGTHYIARESEHRILLPDLPCLGKLRHRWCWQKRQRPYVPVWSHAKVPKVALSPED